MHHDRRRKGMKKFALISIASLALTLAAASGAQAVEPLPIVKAPPQVSTSGPGPDYDPCTFQPPCEAIPPQPPDRFPPCLICEPNPERYPPGYTPPTKAEPADSPPPKVPPGE